MKNIYLAFAVLLVGCNDEGAKTETPAADSAVAKPNASSTSPSSTPWELTVEEIQDDTVFDDGSRPTAWQAAGINDPAAAKVFVKHLKHYVKNNLRDSLADLIQYPTTNGRIKDKKQFMVEYDKIITEKVKQSLAAQKLTQVFRNYQGAMIGSGEIWFRQTENGFRVTSINAE